MSASAMSNSVAVVCSSASEKIVRTTELVLPATATIADLKAATQRALGCDAKKKQAMQVLVGGAMPSESALIGDLASAYGSGERGELRVNYSIEGHFGGNAWCIPIGVCGGAL